MYWITFRVKGVTFQQPAWFANDEMACKYGAPKDVSWFRITTERGRVVLEG